jgi:hypothetical protein
MFAQLERNDVNRWCENFLEALETPLDLPAAVSPKPRKPELLEAG